MDPAPSEETLARNNVTEILRYGHALLATPYACAFLSWDKRPEVIGQADAAAALAELGAAARVPVESSMMQASPPAP